MGHAGRCDFGIQRGEMNVGTIRTVAVGLVLGLTFLGQFGAARDAGAAIIQYEAFYDTLDSLNGPINSAVSVVAGQTVNGPTGVTIVWRIDDTAPPASMFPTAAFYNVVGLDIIYHGVENNFVTPISVPIPGAVVAPSVLDAVSVNVPNGSLDSVQLLGLTDFPIGASGLSITEIHLELFSMDLSILTTLDHPTAAQMNAMSTNAQANMLPDQVRIEFSDGSTNGSVTFTNGTFSSRVLPDAIPAPGGLPLMLGGLALWTLARTRRQHRRTV